MNNQPSVNPLIYLAIYCLNFLGFGMIVGTIGPIIPYLSLQRGMPQTHYSFLFTARTIGSIMAFLSYKFIQHKQWKYLQHKLITLWGMLCFVCCFVFIWWDAILGEYISFLVFGGGHYVVSISANICILDISKQKIGTWMPLVHANFGIGALLAPLIIRLVDIGVYYVIAAIFITFSVLCLIYPTPLKKNEEESSYSLMKQTSNQFVLGSLKLQVLFGLAFFLTIGFETTISGWIPSYAVTTQVFSREQAAICGTISWVVSTSMRLLFALTPQIKASLKLKALLTLTIFFNLLCFLLSEFKVKLGAVVIGSIGLALGISAVFPLLIAVPIEYKLKFRPEQLANLMLPPFLASMFLTGLTGELMKINLDFLFYSFLVMSLSLGMVYFFCSKLMLKESKSGMTISSELDKFS